VTENAFCWGSNEFGQLGNGDNVSSSTPLKVFSDVDSWKTISAGAQHTCGTKNGIEAWCWGNNAHQEVNSSPEKVVLTPSKVTGSWRGVAAGDGYTLAVDGTGKGFGWGLNEVIDVDFAYGGMLGDNSSSMCFDPRTEDLCPDADRVAVEAANPSSAVSEVDLTVRRTENIVPIAGNRLWESITSGGRIPCGIELGTGQLFCWGYTLGEAYVAGSPQSLEPVPLEGPSTNASWVTVSSGIAGSRCGIQISGLGYCWGLNDFDCEDNCPLGDGNTRNSAVPVQVKGVNDWLAPGSNVNTTEAPAPVVDAQIPQPIMTDLVNDADGATDDNGIGGSDDSGNGVRDDVATVPSSATPSVPTTILVLFASLACACL
jgi:alpha-tubulin suppressor-like RCC1 family protein